MSYQVKQDKNGVSNLNPREMLIEIDGSALTTSTADAGVILGLDNVQAKDSSNTVTVTFRRALPNANYAVFIQEITADCKATVTSRTASAFTYTTVENDDTTSAKADADVMILVKYHDASFVR
jgi:hypothetical protein